LSSDTGAICSYSKRADSVALSSTQSEADALVEAIKEITWIQGLIESMLVEISKPVLILVDNKPVVTLAGEGNHIKKSKHFIIKTHYIKESQKHGNVIIQHIKGVDNHADIFTYQGLKGTLLHNHTAGILGNYDIESHEEQETYYANVEEGNNDSE
jgi:hypothetical protein